MIGRIFFTIVGSAVHEKWLMKVFNNQIPSEVSAYLYIAMAGFDLIHQEFIAS